MKTEELKKQLENAQGYEKIKILNQLSSNIKRKDIKNSYEYAKQALELSEKLNFFEGKIDAYINLAWYYFINAKYKIANDYLTKSLSLSKEKNITKFLTEIYYNYALLNRMTGDYKASYDFALKAYNIYEKNDNKHGIARTLNFLGVLSKDLNDYKEAILYYKKALLISKKINDIHLQSYIYNNLAIIYEEKKQYLKASDYYLKTLTLSQKTNDMLTYSNTLNNLGLLYLKRNNLEDAETYLNKAIKEYKKLQDKNGVAISKHNLAKIYIKRREFEKAEKFLKSTLNFFKKTKNINYELFSYEYLEILYETWQNSTKALEYLKKYHKLHTKILLQREKTKLEELKIKFNLSQKQKELRQIKNYNVELKNKNQLDKLLLKKLRANNDFYELILKNSPNAIAILTLDLDIVFANNSFYEIFGVKESVEKNLREVFSQKTLNEILTERKKVLNLGKTTKNYTFTAITKSGIARKLEITISQFKNKENKTLFLVHFKDLTELYEKNKQLRLLQRAVEQSPSSIAITDIFGNLVYVNPRFTKFTGYQPEEVIGKNPRILKSEKADIDYKKLWDTISSGKEWEGIFYNKRKDGTCYWEQARISPVWNEYGKITHYIKIAEDITNKKKAEEKIKKLLIELEKANASKDKFFSIIAHDLKSPFATITAFINIMKKYYDRFSKEKIFELINELDKSTKNTYALLENLLTWSRMQSGSMQYNPENFDLIPIIEKIIRLYEQKAKQKEIQLSYVTPKQVYIFADSFMIETTIRNLINNALKFTAKGGKVTLTIKEQKDNYLIAIKDTGIGIPKDKIKNLFHIDTNFSTYGTDNEKGTGLGLILCKEFIERNNGKITVESQVNKGTTFYLTIPKAKKEKNTKKQNQSEKA